MLVFSVIIVYNISILTKKKDYIMTKSKTNFTYKTLDVVFKEFKEQKDVFAQLNYVKQLKTEAYDYVYKELNLDNVIKRLQNQIIINH
tara:strand:- start:87 stop:350 length:264 start_codon:yes stop_codon:yes gene_type:complete